MKVKAAVLHAPQTPLSIETLELEDPRDDEILVRLVATGVCHTDISMLARPFPVQQPIVLGHEGAGMVEAVGRGVTKVKAGDRVVMSYNACGHCASCLSHAPSYCHDFAAANFVGLRADGSAALSREGAPVRHNFFGQSSFATHSLCTEANVVKVPDSVPDGVFELLGPLGCGIQTGAGAVINVLQPKMGQSLVVFGTGAVGLAGIMAARAIGVGTLVAVDRVPQRLALARELGATHTIDASRIADVPAEVRRITRHGADFSLDTTAVAAVTRQALDALGPLGMCGFVGGAPVGTELVVDVRDMMLKGKTLRGIVEGDANPDVFIPALIEMQAQGRFPFEKLVRLYPFEQIEQAIADSKSGQTVKPILRFLDD
ncbi:NAD(P)-dependent alcohol dehydrogenase [Ramlibacter sp. AW1]|uniref:NAD(P)-dependent alcohol dehydrogenase n=1 Tax=Ramlibacter aurantiacus TaxID=2801330 RepID=A0A936ZNQ2_9BURK|nr:NAD(P)-dependent alcohol dehydrogenase [Ramlibacter aurantiacus]MBL0420700.1 NAD(P)-dependent alcohol dehydrogenase [Ramlibacter aurantiacus]